MSAHPNILWFCFSSRRRHTRWPRDWSSDVCSSDLTTHYDAMGREVFTSWPAATLSDFNSPGPGTHTGYDALDRVVSSAVDSERSEERRVGKEGRCASGAGQEREIRNTSNR